MPIIYPKKIKENMPLSINLSKKNNQKSPYINLSKKNNQESPIKLIINQEESPMKLNYFQQNKSKKRNYTRNDDINKSSSAKKIKLSPTVKASKRSASNSSSPLVIKLSNNKPGTRSSNRKTNANDSPVGKSGPSSSMKDPSRSPCLMISGDYFDLTDSPTTSSNDKPLTNTVQSRARSQRNAAKQANNKTNKFLGLESSDDDDDDDDDDNSGNSNGDGGSTKINEFGKKVVTLTDNNDYKAVTATASSTIATSSSSTDQSKPKPKKNNYIKISERTSHNSSNHSTTHIIKKIPLPTVSVAEINKTLQAKKQVRRRKGNKDFPLDGNKFLLYFDERIHNEDTISCTICGDSDSDDLDHLLFCDGCDLAFHQTCYQITEIPDGNWFCDGCARSKKIQNKCILCPWEGGAVLSFADTKEYCHVLCAQLNPNYFIDWESRTINETSNASTRRSGLQCVLCGEGSEGGCVQCNADDKCKGAIKNCYVAFHPYCAREMKWFTQLGHGGYAYFCANHSSIRYQNLAKEYMAEAGQETHQQKIEGSGNNKMEALRESNTAIKVKIAQRKPRLALFIKENWHIISDFFPSELRSRSNNRFYDQLTLNASLPIELDNIPIPAIGESPDFKKDSAPIMRDYQIEGLRWMLKKHQKEAVGILGDDMGLGKTMQTSCFLAWLKLKCSFPGPHLIVAPLSVLSTWISEINKWCNPGTLDIVKFYGNEKERNRLKRDEMKLGEFDIIVTTYEIYKSEAGWFQMVDWGYVILDEAQRIKNHESDIGSSVRKIRSYGKFLLTGTPLQNNLAELWSLLNFLLPEVFIEDKTLSNFADAFSWNGQNSKRGKEDFDSLFIEKARALLGPLMLRRTKKQVLSAFLPKKVEERIMVPLSPMQKTYYQKFLDRDAGLVNLLAKNSGGSASAEMKLNNLVIQLRKICNHPYIVPELDSQKNDGALITDAGKMVVLDKILDKIRKEGNKVVIFSQFCFMLDIIEDFVRMKYDNFTYFRIDGSTSLTRRKYEMQRFNNHFDQDNFIFLVSTRAGGLGINLQAANYAIMYDTDFNPAIDRQAVDRIYRLGQIRDVTVYRLLTEGTVEDRIIGANLLKSKLGECVLQKQEGDDENDDDVTEENEKNMDENDQPIAIDMLKDVLQKSNSDFKIACSSVSNQSYSAFCNSSWEEIMGGDHKCAVKTIDDLAMNTRKWEGRLFVKKDSIDTGKAWTQMLDGKKRESVSTSITIDTDEKGLGGSITISKWSLEESKYNERLDELNRQRIEASKKKVVRFQHFSHCLACNSKDNIDNRSKTGLRCSYCPSFLCEKCKYMHSNGTGIWSCPGHKCFKCGRAAAECGGLLFRCVTCCSSACDDHIDQNFLPADRECTIFEKQGFVVPKPYALIKCGMCCNIEQYKQF